MHESEVDGCSKLLDGLQQYCDYKSDLDKDLKKCFEAVCQYPNGSSKQKRAVSELIKLAQRLPGLLKSSHQDYSEALSKTWDWFTATIKDPNLGNSLIPRVKCFRPGEPSIQKSLERWINGYLQSRIHDLYAVEKRRMKSLDELDGNGVRIGDTIPDSSTIPSLQGLEDFVGELQGRSGRSLTQRLQDLIDNDSPDHILQGCHPNGYPAANCQTLVQRHILKEPPDTLKAISEELCITYGNLTSHWYRKCLNRLAGITLELGYTSERFKRTIREDIDGSLRALHHHKLPACNAQFLATRLLPCFIDEPATFGQIAEELNAQTFNLSVLDIQHFWEKKCKPRLGGLARKESARPPKDLKRYIEQDPGNELRQCHIRYHPNCNAQSLAMRRLPIFQNPPATFEAISSELQDLDPARRKLDPERIQKHWEQKCLPRLQEICKEVNYQFPEGV